MDKTQDSNHLIFTNNTEAQKIKLLIEEIEKEKSLEYLKSQDLANATISNFSEQLKKLYIIFENMNDEYNKEYKDMENIKKNIESKLGDKNFNLDEEIKKIDNKYDILLQKQKFIEDIFYSLNNFVTDKKSTKNINQSNLSLVPNINDFYVSKKVSEDVKKININNDEDNKITNQNKLRELDRESNPNKEYENIQLKQISNNLKVKKNFHVNNNDMILKNEIQKYYPEYFNLQKFKKHNENSIYLNKKIQREKSKSEEYIDKKEQNLSHKKKKIVNANDKNSEKNKNIYKNVDNYNIFNLVLNKEGEVFVTFCGNIENEFINITVKERNIISKIPFLQCDKFSFLCSRLININNKAFIIGGKSYIDENNNGRNLVFRMDYIINKSNNNIGEIMLFPLKDTIYMHQSHSVIYSESYNTIFVISGKNQRKCEYGILDKQKEIIQDWKEMDSVQYPRQNSLCFLVNERYIFIFGEKNKFSNNNYNYEVFDIYSIFKGKPGIWQNYNFIINRNNESIFNVKIPGIIEIKNNIYVLGGYQYGIGQNLNWKIFFTSDAEDEKDNRNKRITSIVNLRSQSLKDDEKIFSFYGEQKFIKYQNYFINVNMQGKIFEFTQNQLDENIE